MLYQLAVEEPEDEDAVNPQANVQRWFEVWSQTDTPNND